MADVALFEMDVEHEGCDAPTVDAIVPDKVRGHIAVLDSENGGRASTAFTDLGNRTLHLWAFSSSHLDTVQARALGEALVAWADRREADCG